MANLDEIDIFGNASGTVSAYFTSNNVFPPNTGTLLAETPLAAASDANGNNYHLGFLLTAAQTTAFQSGSNDIVIYNAAQNQQIIFTNGGEFFAANGIQEL